MGRHTTSFQNPITAEEEKEELEQEEEEEIQIPKLERKMSFRDSEKHKNYMVQLQLASEKIFLAKIRQKQFVKLIFVL